MATRCPSRFLSATYQLTEVPPQPADAGGRTVPFTLHSAQEVAKVRNQLTPAAGPYNG